MHLTQLWPVALTPGLRFAWAGADELNGAEVPGAGGLQLFGQAGAAYHLSRALVCRLDLLVALYSHAVIDQLLPRLTVSIGAVVLF